MPPEIQSTSILFRKYVLMLSFAHQYYSPLPLAAAMLAATPFPHGEANPYDLTYETYFGSGANLAVAGFVVGTLSDQLLPSGHSS
jgi:hypothetical protein